MIPSHISKNNPFTSNLHQSPYSFRGLILTVKNPQFEARLVLKNEVAFKNKIKTRVVNKTFKYFTTHNKSETNQ